MKSFTKEITKHEKIPTIKIQATHAVVYTVQTRSSTPYLRINAFCSTSELFEKDLFVRYKAKLDNNPFKGLNSSSASDYINVTIE